LDTLVLAIDAHTPIWAGAQGNAVVGRCLWEAPADILRPYFEQRWDLIQPMLTTIGTGIVSKVRLTGMHEPNLPNQRRREQQWQLAFSLCTLIYFIHTLERLLRWSSKLDQAWQACPEAAAIAAPPPLTHSCLEPFAGAGVRELLEVVHGVYGRDEEHG
jgi:hypothetical protein